MMTPLELQNKWNLTNTELAVALGKSEETIRKYKISSSSKGYRKPPETVVRLCCELDKDWSRKGKASIQLLLA